MKYTVLGKTGYEVSRVIYGGLVSDKTASSDAFVGWAVEHGVNYFDVAPTYGEAQANLGPSLVPYRKDVYLACKSAEREYESAKNEMLKSKELLKTDYFDVYQIHGMSTMQEFEVAFSGHGIINLLDEMKKSGEARKVGFTCHSEEVALRALDCYDFDTVLFPYNWYQIRTFGMGERLIKKLKERNIGALCMKSMIDRAWIKDRDQEMMQRFNKSWCKPFNPDTEGGLINSAVRKVFDLGVDVIVPPGNFEHFRYGVEHIDEILSAPYGEKDEAALSARFEENKGYPFFTFDGPDAKFTKY